MNVTTALLFDEQRDTLLAAATNARDQAQACATSLRLLPSLQAEYRNRAAALERLGHAPVELRAGKTRNPRSRPHARSDLYPHRVCT